MNSVHEIIIVQYPYVTWAPKAIPTLSKSFDNKIFLFSLSGLPSHTIQLVTINSGELLPNSIIFSNTPEKEPYFAINEFKSISPIWSGSVSLIFSKKSAAILPRPFDGDNSGRGSVVFKILAASS